MSPKAHSSGYVQGLTSTPYSERVYRGDGPAMRPLQFLREQRRSIARVASCGTKNRQKWAMTFNEREESALRHTQQPSSQSTQRFSELLNVVMWPGQSCLVFVPSVGTWEERIFRFQPSQRNASGQQCLHTFHVVRDRLRALELVVSGRTCYIGIITSHRLADVDTHRRQIPG